MAVLELKNIRKSYFLGKEEFPVLKGIDLEFERGDFVSLLGESGGGKSTLMNIIGGLDRKYEGDVIVDGLAQKNKKRKRYGCLSPRYYRFYLPIFQPCQLFERFR